MLLLLIIPVYLILNLYILHRVHKWLTACSALFHSRWFIVPYITVYSLLGVFSALCLPAACIQAAGAYQTP